MASRLLAGMGRTDLPLSVRAVLGAQATGVESPTGKSGRSSHQTWLDRDPLA
jgi:hypothetical protein